MDSPGLTRFALAIEHMEGSPGTRSYRNNNPFDFRYTPYIRSLGAVSHDAQNFAIFPSFDTGFRAGLQFLRDAQANLLIAYRLYAKRMRRPGNMCTLGDFFQVYAPSSDSNNPTRYAQHVADYIGNGVSVDTPINRI